MVPKLRTREGVGDSRLPNGVERLLRSLLLAESRIYVSLMYARGMCWVSMLYTHLRAEGTAAISNTAISWWQKVVEQGGSLN